AVTATPQLTESETVADTPAPSVQLHSETETEPVITQGATQSVAAEPVVTDEVTESADAGLHVSESSTKPVASEPDAEPTSASQTVDLPAATEASEVELPTTKAPAVEAEES